MKLTNNPDRINQDSWSDFVKRHKNGNVFQTPEFFSVHKKTSNQEPIVICAYEGDKIFGILVSFIQWELPQPFSFFSSRTLVIGGPLIEPKYYNVLLPYFLSRLELCISTKSIFTEIRNLSDINSKIDIFKKQGYNFSDHLNFIVDLSIDEESLWGNLSQSKRRSIRRGNSNGSVVKLSDSESELFNFYDGLKSFYKEVVKKPLPDFLISMGLWMKE